MAWPKYILCHIFQIDYLLIFDQFFGKHLVYNKTILIQKSLHNLAIIFSIDFRITLWILQFLKRNLWILKDFCMSKTNPVFKFCQLVSILRKLGLNSQEVSTYSRARPVIANLLILYLLFNKWSIFVWKAIKYKIGVDRGYKRSLVLSFLRLYCQTLSLNSWSSLWYKKTFGGLFFNNFSLKYTKLMYSMSTSINK